MEKIKRGQYFAKRKEVSITITRKVSMFYTTEVGISVPEGLTDEQERNLIKEFVLENQYNYDLIYLGEPSEDWPDEIQKIEAYYNNPSEYDNQLIFVEVVS